MDDNGNPVHPGDMAAQVVQALDSLETVLKQAEYGLSDIVRLNHYTTDVDAFIQATEVWGRRLGESGRRPASTLLGVARLAFPELFVVIEATAMS